jgi:hypothetical protein
MKALHKTKLMAFAFHQWKIQRLCAADGNETAFLGRSLMRLQLPRRQFASLTHRAQATHASLCSLMQRTDAQCMRNKHKRLHSQWKEDEIEDECDDESTTRMKTMMVAVMLMKMEIVIVMTATTVVVAITMEWKWGWKWGAWGRVQERGRGRMVVDEDTDKIE